MIHHLTLFFSLFSLVQTKFYVNCITQPHVQSPKESWHDINFADLQCKQDYLCIWILLQNLVSSNIRLPLSRDFIWKYVIHHCTKMFCSPHSEPFHLGLTVPDGPIPHHQNVVQIPLHNICTHVPCSSAVRGEKKCPDTGARTGRASSGREGQRLVCGA